MEGKQMNEKKKLKSIKFHNFDEKGNCFAEVTLPFTERVIKNIKVTNRYGRVFCYIPESFNGKWYFKEIKWIDVSLQIVEDYKKMVGIFNPYQKVQKPNTVTEPQFTFFRIDQKKFAIAEISFNDTSATLRGVYVQSNSHDKSVYVSRPKSLEYKSNFNTEEWKKISTSIETEYRRQLLGEKLEKVNDYKINFVKTDDYFSCIANAHIPGKKLPIKGFKIKMFENGKVEISLPAGYGKWKEPNYDWQTFRSDFAVAFRKELIDTGKLIVANTLENRIEKKEIIYNHYGRVANDIYSDFLYYPNCMLKNVEGIKETAKKKNLNLVATALSKGTQGGIGPFEINALWWIAKLRYLTHTMFLDLAEHGYISLGWRESVSKKKLSGITKRMKEYDMINISKLCGLDENGNEIIFSKSKSRIMTLAPNGSAILKELNKDVHGYNQFDILHDGNYIKRHLVTNQWLIYWLCYYKDRIGESYEVLYSVQQKGFEYISVKIYALVTIDGITMAAEAVRRVGEFEYKENKRRLINKVGRMIKIFNNLDQLYNNNQKVEFGSRPIIVLLCEDDDHIEEVAQIVSELMKENPEQEFWFSTDLRVYNMDYMGQRFLKYKDSKLDIINLAEYFSRDDEIEKDILYKKLLTESLDESISYKFNDKQINNVDEDSTDNVKKNTQCSCEYEE